MEQSIPIIPATGSLRFGEACPVSSYRWAGEVSSSGIERFAFRATAPCDAKDFTAEYFDAQGKSLRKGPPSIRSTEDADGMTVIAVELVIPAGAATAKLTGLKSTSSVLIGPDARESYSTSSEGPMVGAPVTVRVPEGIGTVILHSFLVTGKASTPINYALRFYDGEGQELLPSAETSVSPILGSYVAGPTLDVTGEVEIPVPLPEGTASLQVRPLKSKPESATSVRLSATMRHRDEDSLDAFLEGLGHEVPLILIDSTAPPLGSGLITIRPNNMTLQYSSMGYAVISVGYGDLQTQKRRPMDLVYQAPRAEFNDVVDAVVGQSQLRTCLYVCSSFPSSQALATVDFFNQNGWKTLYEIRDDMEEFRRVGYSKWYTPESEALICQRSQFVTTVSPALTQKAHALSRGVAFPETIPNGIHERFIVKAAPLRNLSAVEQKRQEGIIGYVGHLTEAWFDWDMVLRFAEEHPNRTIQIIGPGMPSAIRLPDSIVYLGAKKQEELQSFTERWTVGLIPFKKSPLTRGVDPNKLFEYCAWGMRTVSADMGSIRDCPTAEMYNTYAEMSEAIESALARPWTQSELDQAELFLRESTWRKRAERTLEVVGL